MVEGFELASEFVVCVRPYIEFLYFISTIGLFVIAIYGLRQIKLAKQSILIHTRRESTFIAIQQCMQMCDRFIPEMKRVAIDISEKKITFFKDSQVEIVGNSIKVKYPTDAKSFNTIRKMGPELHSLLNELEGFAIHFTKGLADEKAAFESVGRVYCSFITRHAAYVKMQSREHRYYRNLLSLFFTWNKRIEIEDQKMALAESVAQLDKKTKYTKAQIEKLNKESEDAKEFDLIGLDK